MNGRHDALLRPRRVAVVGASGTLGKWGHRVVHTLKAAGFPGDVAAVNRTHREILGYRAYPSVADLPWAPDVAVVMVDRGMAVAIVEELASRGCRYAVVHTAGFAETGAAGAALQERLVQTARGAGMRLLGPNCMNLMVSASRLNLTGIPDLPMGRLAFVSQSGNLVYELLEYGKVGGPGLSSFISVGNQADLGIEDFLDDLARDPHTAAVALYIEGLRPGSGRPFLEAARRLTSVKPVVALLGGRSDSGRKASSSHTASILDETRALQGLLRQAGIIDIDRLDEFFPIADALIKSPSPPAATAALCGSGGGHATIGADALNIRGVRLPPLDAHVQQEVTQLLPEVASHGNPIDWVGASAGDAWLYEKVARLLLGDPGIGGLVLFGHFGGYVTGENEPAREYCDVASALGSLQRETGKPVLVHSVYWRQRRAAFEALRHASIPVFGSLEVAASAFHALARRARLRSDVPRPHDVCRDDLLEPHVRRARDEGRDALLEPEALSWLSQLGLPVPEHLFATTAEAAARYAMQLKVPVAVKLVSPTVLHKSDVGAVRLGLDGPDRVASAFTQLRQTAAMLGADFRGALVVPMAGPGVEVAVGIARSALVGPVMVFASGGTAIEALDDVSTRPIPIDDRDAEEMIEETRAGRLLVHRRGTAVPRIGPLRELMVRLSIAAAGSHLIEAIDLNPILVSDTSISILDARVILHRAVSCTPASERVGESRRCGSEAMRAQNR